MKRKSLILIMVLMIALLFSSITAASAKPNASPLIKCVVDIQTSPPGVKPDWYGTIEGEECSIAGTVTFNETDENFDAGKSGHFFEEFTIKPYSGGEIHGEDNGVWNFSTFKFRANGRVTGASEEWADLVGYKFHEMGRTTDPFDPEADVVSAPGTIMTLH